MSLIKCLFLIIFGLFFLFFFNNLCISEDILMKGGGKYLGWQISKTDFKTCKETIIEIADGKIIKTDDKCERSGPPIPMLTGRVIEINENNSTFIIVDKDGKKEQYFTPDLRKKITINDMGRFLFFEVPTRGRADNIRIKERKGIGPAVMVDQLKSY